MGDSPNCYNFTQDDGYLNCNNNMIYTTEYKDPLPAIYAQDVNNIRIMNCFIQNYSWGIEFVNVSNSSIINTTLFNITDVTTGDVSAVGVNLSYGSDNNTINVNVSHLNATTFSGSGCYTGNAAYGVYVSNSDLNMIINSTFNDIHGTSRVDGDEMPGCTSYANSMGDALRLQTAYNNTVYNSTFNDTRKYGMVSTSSLYSNVTDNYFSYCMYSISISTGGFNSTIYGNKVTNSLWGISSTGTYPNIEKNTVNYSDVAISCWAQFCKIDDNVVMHSMNSGRGAPIYGAVEFNSFPMRSFDNNTIYNTSYPGYFGAVYSGSATEASNNNITNTTTAYYFGGGGTHCHIYNDTIVNAGNDTYFGSTTCEYYNVSFNKSNIIFAAGTLHVYNWVANNVTDTNFVGLDQAAISIYDSFDVLVATQTTNPEGISGGSWVEEYNQTDDATYVDGCVGSGADITCRTPHKIRVSKPGYRMNDSIANLSFQTLFNTFLRQSDFILRFTINNTDAMVQYGDSNPIPAWQMGSLKTVIDPNYYYMASYSGNAVTGLVSPGPTKAIGYGNDTNTHQLYIQYDLVSNPRRFIIPFSKGDWHEINNRMVDIESGDFFLNIKPTFGFGLGTLYPIKIVLQPGMFDIIGNFLIQKGKQKVAISYNGSVDSIPTIVVDKL